MIITISMHKKPRTETLKLVPSQVTERHQAVDVPAVWDRPSIVSRFDDHHWAVALALIAVSVLVGALVAIW